jgi:hypothetical protein
MESEQREREAAALKAERLGYERRGLPERVAQVDAQMKRIRGEGADRQTRPRGAGASTRAGRQAG